MNIDEQVALLMQGTEYGDEDLKKTMANELRQRLLEAEKEHRPLRVYCGFDPRTSDLHLGHTVPMRKLQQFQELGHEVTFVVGSFTSLIGDPSDQDKLRPQLTAEQVEFNARTYAEQAYKILQISAGTSSTPSRRSRPSTRMCSGTWRMLHRSRSSSHSRADESVTTFTAMAASRAGSRGRHPLRPGP